MSMLRDIALIGRFEVFRAIRTWRALALFLLYGIAYGGASYLFIAALHAMENSVARQLGVARTTKPGALLDKLVESETFADAVVGMTGNDQLLELVHTIPPLAIFAMWLGLLLIPFFAASTSAESISVDMSSRALRFEALRTGRVQIYLGRFVGQLLLTGVASLLAVAVVWSMGMLFMVGHTAYGLAYWLLALTARAWCFSAPFAGLGLAASALTLSSAWARVMAIGATAGSWVLYGIARVLERTEGYAWIADLVIPLLPQGWMRALWTPGLGWLPAAAVCGALGLLVAGAGYLRFHRRDF